MGSQVGALVGGIWGDPGKNFVDLQGGPSEVFGQRPQVAPFVPVDLGAEIGKATGFNLENLDSISALLNEIMPGFSDILGAQQQNLTQVFQNAASELRGELPPDVVDQIQRSSAGQALQGGYGGTAMAQANTARNLGLSSLDLTNQGAQLSALGGNSAQMWAKLAEEAFSPFVVSTGQTAGTTAANQAGLQAQQQYQFNVNASPDPGALGIFNVDAALGQQMLSFGMGALGGIGGGGSAGGSAQAPVPNNSMGGGYAAQAPAYNPYNPYVGLFNSAGTGSTWGGYGGGG